MTEMEGIGGGDQGREMIKEIDTAGDTGIIVKGDHTQDRAVVTVGNIGTTIGDVLTDHAATKETIDKSTGSEAGLQHEGTMIVMQGGETRTRKPASKRDLRDGRNEVLIILRLYEVQSHCLAEQDW